MYIITKQSFLPINGCLAIVCYPTVLYDALILDRNKIKPRQCSQWFKRLIPGTMQVNIYLYFLIHNLEHIITVWYLLQMLFLWITDAIDIFEYNLTCNIAKTNNICPV